MLVYRYIYIIIINKHIAKHIQPEIVIFLNTLSLSPKKVCVNKKKEKSDLDKRLRGVTYGFEMRH